MVKYDAILPTLQASKDDAVASNLVEGAILESL